MNYSAQAIVIDNDRQIYLERNSKFNSLSFFGWKVEEGETYEQVLIREIEEELWIRIRVERLLAGQEQGKRIFPTWEWVSKYFVLHLDNTETNILGNTAVEVYSFQELERLHDNEFPFERVSFLQQIQRALDTLY